ncbi:MAG: lipoyl(octanoyl) transferase LipB [Herminiimonas sp.]|nr:lipoyl(octanoyl) transferase LipB [Herminiimonas sp.]
MPIAPALPPSTPAANFTAASTVTSVPQVIDRGCEPYALTYAAMREFTDNRDPATPDQLWIVEHAPVMTLGLGADPAHVLDAGSIPVIQTDRGGEVTYHGPGQAIVYLLIDLRRSAPGARLYAREFVRGIEQAVIDTLAAYNLDGARHAGAPGIYLDAPGPWQGAKIAALGLKVRGNGCTYHGVALNVAMEMAPFSRINACGYPGLVTVDMRTVGVTAELQAVQSLLAANLLRNLGQRAAAAVTPTTD